MANQYHASTPAKIQTLLNALRTALTLDGAAMDVDYKDSVGMKITLIVANDGQSVSFEVSPSDQGQSNRFGAVEGGGSTRLGRRGPKIIPITSLP